MTDRKILTPIDLQTGTWLRLRAELVRKLWRARAELEKNLDPLETAQYRERILTIQEVLKVDPRKDDWELAARAAAQSQEMFPASSYPSFPEETVGDE